MAVKIFFLSAFSTLEVDEIIAKLQNVASIMLTWFQSNYLQANSDKFQFILYNSDDKYMLTIYKNVKLESWSMLSC